jgi:outer membrane protein TolC
MISIYTKKRIFKKSVILPVTLISCEAMRKLIPFVLFIFGNFFLRDSQSRSISFQNFWDQVQVNSEAMNGAKSEVKTQEYFLNVARSGYYPQVSLEANSIKRKTDGPLFSTDVVLSQPLDIFWNQSSLVDQARLQLEMAQLKYQKSRYSVLKKTLEFVCENDFLTQELKTLEKLIQLQNGVLKTTLEKYRIGSESELSVLSSQSKIEQWNIEKAEKEREIETFQKKFQVEFEYQMTDFPSLVLGFEKLQALYKFMEKEVIAKESLEYAILQHEMKYRELKKQTDMIVHFPRLYFIAGAGYSDNAYWTLANFNSNSSYYLGLKLDVPLFSGLSSFSERKAKAQDIETLRMSLQSTKKSSEVLRYEKLGALNQGLEIFEKYKKIEENSQKAETTARQMYRLGTLGYFQFSEIQKTRAESELGRIGHLRSFAKNLYSLIEFFPINEKELISFF